MKNIQLYIYRLLFSTEKFERMQQLQFSCTRTDREYSIEYIGSKKVYSSGSFIVSKYVSGEYNVVGYNEKIEAEYASEVELTTDEQLQIKEGAKIRIQEFIENQRAEAMEEYDRMLKLLDKLSKRVDIV